MPLDAFRGGNPLERIVAKPLNCHLRANSRDTGIWEMPNRGITGILGGSDITFRRDRPGSDQSERATCILYI